MTWWDEYYLIFSLPEHVPDELHKILEPGVHIDSKTTYFNARVFSPSPKTVLK
jgi:hypothetical protein